MTNPKITDQAIVELFLSRDETAMRESQDRYAAYCQTIARRILGNEQDAEECVNDTWLSAWQSIPPHRPQNLARANHLCVSGNYRPGCRTDGKSGQERIRLPYS